jgi:hypothetical protein
MTMYANLLPDENLQAIIWLAETNNRNRTRPAYNSGKLPRMPAGNLAYSGMGEMLFAASINLI